MLSARRDLGPMKLELGDGVGVYRIEKDYRVMCETCRRGVRGRPDLR